MMFHCYSCKNLTRRNFKLKMTRKLTPPQKKTSPTLEVHLRAPAIVVGGLAEDYLVGRVFHPLNRLNARVWATSSLHVPTVSSVKHPARTTSGACSPAVRCPSCTWCPRKQPSAHTDAAEVQNWPKLSRFVRTHVVYAPLCLNDSFICFLTPDVSKSFFLRILKEV